MGTGNYSDILNNIKLVHWPLMGARAFWYSEKRTGRGLTLNLLQFRILIWLRVTLVRLIALVNRTVRSVALRGLLLQQPSLGDSARKAHRRTRALRSHMQGVTCRLLLRYKNTTSHAHCRCTIWKSNRWNWLSAEAAFL